MATLPIVNTFDKRAGVVTSILAMVGLLVLLFILTFEIADPAPEDIPMTMAEPMDVTEIENVVVDAGGGGGGSASENPRNTDPRQTEQIISNDTPSDVQVNAGDGNVTNSNQNNPPSGNNVENHFGDGGTDGQGGGSGGPFGNDTGPGNDNGDPGLGAGSRKIIKHVHFNLDYDHPVTFNFKVLIDANGNVMSAQVIKGTTSTTDQVLINKVLRAVKKQVKYSKAPGSPAMSKIYTITLRPV